jgi:N-acetylglucosaminyldiphosphoundecaprenol N-acetyl-beta-D-mannosaminyltransferase
LLTLEQGFSAKTIYSYRRVGDPMTDFNRSVFCVLGLPVDALTMAQAGARLESAYRSRRTCFMSTPNLNFVIGSQKNPLFRASVCQSDLSLADGMPLVWIGRLLGIALPERVSGSGLFDWIRQHSGHRWRVFFFGGQRGVGQDAVLDIGDQEARMESSGYIYPGMGSVQDMSRPDLIDCINQSQSDFLVVSLGAAKGQAWIVQNLAKLNVPVISHLGAVVNFVAGTVKRAPTWMQKTGLEWLWRIKEEPGLFKRYWHDGLALLGIFLTRVLPLLFWQRIGSAPESDYASAKVAQNGSDHQAKLMGAWRHDNLTPVRVLFTHLSEQMGPVQLDLSETTDADNAFMALLLLLDQSLCDKGSRLQLLRVPVRLRRLMLLNGLGHMEMA